MRHVVLFLLFISASAASAQLFIQRSGVQFYFSDAGGSSERLTTDLVTGPNWTGEYDVYAKNTRAESIQFDFGVLMVGYARSNFAGQQAPMIPGSDRVTIFDPQSVGLPANSNPNVTARASWFVGNGNPALLGGRHNVGGTPRPYGMNLPMDPLDQVPIPIASGESIFLARIKFRDNGLFAAQGFHDLVLYDYDESPSNYATTSLKIPFGSNFLVYHDGPDWEENSRLCLVAVPEPTGIAVALVGFAGLFLKGRKRK